MAESVIVFSRSRASSAAEGHTSRVSSCPGGVQPVSEAVLAKEAK